MYRQVVGVVIGTNCAPLVADLFLFCYEMDFMMSLDNEKQADIIEAFNIKSTSRYLDDISNIKYEPVHENSNNVICATSKASDQPAHTRSLIRAFANRLSIL